MSKTEKSSLTGIFESAAQPVPLTIRATSVEDGRIVCRPLIVTGPFRLFVVDGPELPPELLERLIFLPNEPEDSSCP